MNNSRRTHTSVFWGLDLDEDIPRAQTDIVPERCHSNRLNSKNQARVQAERSAISSDLNVYVIPSPERRHSNRLDSNEEKQSQASCAQISRRQKTIESAKMQKRFGIFLRPTLI